MTHFSAIGFVGASDDDVVRKIEVALGRSLPPQDLGPDAAAHYRWFRDVSGAALGARLDARKSVECMTPFFAPSDGGTRWRVHTTEPHLDRECLHCSGADCDVLDPETGEMCTRTGLQFLFFEPYGEWLKGDRTFEVAVVGFAANLSLCSTADDLEKVQALRFGAAEHGVEPQPGQPLRLADQAFVPYGLFGQGGHLGERARVLLTGHVESAKLLTNEVGGEQFVHARVRTLGGALDLVAAASEVEVPEHPRFAIAECWLVGRPVEPPPAKKGLFRRLFGRG